VSRAIAVLALAACGDNAGTDAELASGSRLQLVTYMLSDGALFADRSVFHDRVLDEDCRVARFSSGVRYCMPVAAGGSTVFTEGSCTRVLGAERVGRTPPAYFVRSYTMHGVVLPSRLYRSGAPAAAPALVWQLEDGYCLGPYPVDPALAYYAVGDAVTTDDLVEIRASDMRRVGRLSVSIDTSDDGWRAPGEIRDETLAVACVPDPAPNAPSTVCLPLGLPRVSYYADAGCTAPLTSHERALHRDHASGCVAVVERGPPVPGAGFQPVDGRRVPVPPPAGPPDPPASTTELATLARSVEGGGRAQPIRLGDVEHDALVHDAALGADCTIGGGRCAPVSSVEARTYFSDDACVTPVDVAFVPTGACEPPARFASGRTIGALHTATLYEPTTGDRCAAYTPPSRFAVHDLGEAPADVMVATRQR